MLPARVLCWGIKQTPPCFPINNAAAPAFSPWGRRTAHHDRGMSGAHLSTGFPAPPVRPPAPHRRAINGASKRCTRAIRGPSLPFLSISSKSISCPTGQVNEAGCCQYRRITQRLQLELIITLRPQFAQPEQGKLEGSSYFITVSGDTDSR